MICCIQQLAGDQHTGLQNGAVVGDPPEIVNGPPEGVDGPAQASLGGAGDALHALLNTNLIYFINIFNSASVEYWELRTIHQIGRASCRERV